MTLALHLSVVTRVLCRITGLGATDLEAEDQMIKNIPSNINHVI